jgi:hypothetical protein
MSDQLRLFAAPSVPSAVKVERRGRRPKPTSVTAPTMALRCQCEQPLLIIEDGERGCHLCGRMVGAPADARLGQLRKGLAVVVNLRAGTDDLLKAWSLREGLLVNVDRGSRWGNPFKIGLDGDRAAVIERYRLEVLPGLLPYVDQLQGKALGGWCWPLESHADLLADAAHAGDELD